MAGTATLNSTLTSQKAPEAKVDRNTPGLFNDGREQQLERERDLDKTPETGSIPDIFTNAFTSVTSEVGNLGREATSAMADLINIARGAETPLVNTPSQGRIENFNEPHGQQMNLEEAVADAQRIIQEHAKERQAKLANTEAEINQVFQLRAVQEDARFEVSMLTDEQFAQKADYKNISFKGARNLPNKLLVFAKFVAEKLQLIKEKAAPHEIIGKRTSSKGVVSGADELKTRIYGADIKRTFEDHNMQGLG